MNIWKDEANGRGTCKICQKPIKKGLLQYIVSLFGSTARAHIECFEKAVKEAGPYYRYRR